MNAAATETLHFRDRIINEHARGLSFADIGALWGTRNEKVSVAAHAGARSTAIIDISPAGDPAWQRCREHCAQRGVTGYAEHSHDLNDPDIHKKVGTFDFVHCSGVLYHAPSIFYTLQRLYSLTDRYLLIGSMVVPELIENEFGTLQLGEGGLLFVPAISGGTRKILERHFAQMGLTVMHLTPTQGPVQPFMWEPGRPNYGPWWWIYSLSTLRSLVATVGFRVVDSSLHWGGRSGSIFCEKPKGKDGR